MACCKAGKYAGWCEKFLEYDETIEFEGEEYCIFHAPASEKYRFSKSMQDVIYDYIKYLFRIKSILLSENRLNEDQFEIDFSGTIFTDKFNGNVFLEAFSDHIDIKYSPKPVTAPHGVMLDILTHDGFIIAQNEKDSFTLPKTNFSYAEFNDDADFNSLTFDNEIKFSGCIFNAEANFSQTTFHKETTFSGCNFNGVTFFKKCKFLSEVKYAPLEERQLKFEGNAYFDDAEFHAESSFFRCGFKNELIFDNANFKKLFEFTHSKVVKSHSSFRNCLFSGKANFSNSQFLSATFALSTFEDNVFFDFTCFYKSLEIHHSNFDRVVSFSAPRYFGKFQVGSSFFASWVYINDLFFVDEISFNRTICEKKIIMERVTVKKMSFLSTNIESFQFIDCWWGKNILQHVIYDRCKSDHGITYQYIATIYRRLKRIAKDNADEMLASDWHYMEKEMQRKHANSTLKKSAAGINVLILILVIFFLGLIFIPTPATPLLMMSSVALVLTCKLFKLRQQIKYSAPTSVHPDWVSVFFLNSYYLISGYGEKPLRALIWLAIFIFLPAFIPLDLTAYQDPQWLKDTVNYLPLMKATPDTSSLTIFFNGLGRIIITIQAALFAFALRNKLRR